jgi:tripartite-type tricarboxylate transporter receptor subunit TctC
MNTDNSRTNLSVDASDFPSVCISVYLRLIVSGFAVLTVFGAGAHAQSYPTKPIRLIVGFAPGGVTDIVSRALGQKLYERLGQQVVVDNRAGGSGTIAAVSTAKAPPDGYTLLMSSISTMATNVSTVQNLPYDPVRDFAPITLALVTPYLATVTAAMPANNLREFIALAKTRPGQFNFGSSGTGGGAHLAVELFKVMAGIGLTHVPYKGSSLALNDLLGGHIQLTFSQPPIVLAHIRSGKLKGLAISSAHRLAALPEFPTIAEAGLAGYEATSWQGIVAPANTPRAILMMLNSEIRGALRLPDIGARLAAEGSEAGDTTPDEFGAYIKREIAKWQRVVTTAGIKID